MLSNSSKRLGAILSGGRSSRFGSDKAEAVWGERRLVEHAAAAIAPWVEAIVVCGPHYLGFHRVMDRPCHDMGPLAGVCGALVHALDHELEAVVTIACDMPIVPAELMARLVEGGSRYCTSVPVLACWESRSAPVLERYLLDGGRRSVRAWAEASGASAVAWGDLPNINTPADLAKL